MQLKEKIKENFPQILQLYSKYRKKFEIILDNKKNKEVFDKIYETNHWEDGVSRSGPGSTIENTKNFHDSLLKLFSDYKVRTLLDAPCGDFNWMKELAPSLENYIGVDIVEKLVEDNNKKFGNEKVRFIFADIVKDDLPKSVMILCRDCLVHLSNGRVIKTIKNFKKSGAKYILATTFTEVKENADILTGEWRKVNMELKPFCFPKSLELIYENCPATDENGELSKDKHLGLWALDDIKL